MKDGGRIVPFFTWIHLIMGPMNHDNHLILCTLSFFSKNIALKNFRSTLTLKGQDVVWNEGDKCMSLRTMNYRDSEGCAK
jgi:hypothetical protein